jgi:TadE-like protein
MKRTHSGRSPANGTTTVAASGRRGAAIVESALVLGLFLTLLLGGLDLSLMTLRENTLAEAARRLARSATLHGSDAPAGNRWGPAEYEGTADEATPYADEVREILLVVDPAQVEIQITWPDGENASGNRVQVQLTSLYPALTSLLFDGEPYLLQAVSTMTIEH